MSCMQKIGELREEFESFDPKKEYLLIFVGIEDYYKLSKNSTEEDIELVKFSLLNIFSDIYSLNKEIVINGAETLDGVCLLISLQADIDVKEMRVKIYNDTFSILDKIENILNNDIRVAITNIHDFDFGNR